MQKTDTVFAGSVPALYDSHMVPLIFAHYANDLAHRAAAENPGRVLEIAAGTGVVTRALAPLLRDDARYLVTDLNPGMLEQAKMRQSADTRLGWSVADAANLGVEQGAYDLALCQFGAMFFPDRTACYASIRNALRPGGLWLFNVWDSIEVNEFAHAVMTAVCAMFPDDPPIFMQRTPHGYGDRDRIRADVAAAGYSDIMIETIEAQSRASSARDVAIAFCQGTPFRGEIEARDSTRLQEATANAEAAVAERWGRGPVAARMQAHVISARA